MLAIADFEVEGRGEFASAADVFLCLVSALSAAMWTPLLAAFDLPRLGEVSTSGIVFFFCKHVSLSAAAAAAPAAAGTTEDDVGMAEVDIDEV